MFLGTTTKMTDTGRTGEVEGSCQPEKGGALLGTDLFLLRPSCLTILGSLYTQTLPTGLEVPQTQSCLKPDVTRQGEGAPS